MVIGLLFWIGIIGVASSSSGDHTVTLPPAAPHEVRYWVGDGTGAVTMVTPSGMSQLSDVTGLVGTFTFHDGEVVVMSVQNAGNGSITCVITSDGAEIARQTSTGEFVIASCDAVI